MNWSDFIQHLPVAAWLTIVLVLIIVGVFLYEIASIIKTKDIKLRNIEIASETQKELYQTEGKNVLDNQTSNAHNLLKQIWIDIYRTGIDKFKITDLTEQFLLEDIAHLIESKLNYEVKNDLTRNHITSKDDIELTKYSDAKATGYYKCVKANLYTYNIQLPKYNLPDIMDDITIEDYKKKFLEIYFSARKIAGGEH